jgi:hypothetical protein
MCIGSPEPHPGFRVIHVGAHDSSTSKRLGIPLDLLISKPLLESRFPKEIRSNKLVTDAGEEVAPPRVVNVPAAQPAHCLVQTLLQEIIVTAKWHLPCLPLPVHTTYGPPDRLGHGGKRSGKC